MRLNSYCSPSFGGVRHPHGVELDRDAALALEVERVEHLLLHLTLLQRPGGLDQSIGQRRLAVIDVRDDAEVADVIELQGRLNGGRSDGHGSERTGRTVGRGVEPIAVAES